MTIYLIYKNSDTIEGRGPMVLMKDLGYFENEDAAWESLRGMGGVMGRLPLNGDWRGSKMGDYDVRPINRAVHPKMYPLPEVGDVIDGGTVHYARRLNVRHCVVFLLFPNMPKPFTVVQYDIKAALCVGSRDYTFLNEAMDDYTKRDFE